MTNHPNRSQSARKQAQAAGYYIREGAYQGTTDDRLGRWYFGHDDDNGFRPWGAGHRTQREAWEAALEHATNHPNRNRKPATVYAYYPRGQQIGRFCELPQGMTAGRANRLWPQIGDAPVVYQYADTDLDEFKRTISGDDFAGSVYADECVRLVDYLERENLFGWYMMTARGVVRQDAPTAD